MNKKALLLGGVLGAMALAPQAMAQERGWYGAFDLGYHWPEGLEVTGTGNSIDGDPFRFDIQQEEAVVGFARLGYQVTPNWRVELEGGVRTGDIESAEGDPTRPTPNAICAVALPVAPCRGPEGSIEYYSLMGNLIYDFVPESSFRPFVGAGIGVVYADADISGRLNNLVFGGGVGIHDDDTAFAWQLLAGVSFDITQRLTGDVTYRWLKTNDIRLTSTSTGLAQPGDLTGSFEDQSLTFGLRYSFAQAAPPPPPPAPPEEPPPPPPAPPEPPPPPAPPAYEAREFIVYFPFDQSILTPEAQTVVSEAAQYANAGNATRIVVVGHADTSGSASYNVGLSQRRAKAVADGLVAAGVNSGALSVDWKGEAEPAVATGDGVKEPLNRRATIQINF